MSVLSRSSKHKVGRITWSPSTASGPIAKPPSDEPHRYSSAESTTPPVGEQGSSVDDPSLWPSSPSRPLSFRDRLRQWRRSLGSPPRSGINIVGQTRPRLKAAPKPLRGRGQDKKTSLTNSSSSLSSGLTETRAGAWVFPELLGPLTPVSDVQVIDSLGPVIPMTPSSNTDLGPSEEEGSPEPPTRNCCWLC